MKDRATVRASGTIHSGKATLAKIRPNSLFHTASSISLSPFFQCLGDGLCAVLADQILWERALPAID
jgi:hypothetical protein